MARITHVCISDLHSGAAPSLATNVEEPHRKRSIDAPSPTSTAFGAAVQALLQQHNAETYSADTAPPESRPELILMGDLLDLAFSDRGDAGISYVSWLKALLGTQSDWFAPDTVFLPGNHDHSLWTGARMAAEAASAASGNIVGLASSTPAIDPGALTSPLITALNKQAGIKGTCHIRYPNYALVSDDKSRVVAFHHGHFVDAMYRLMSNVYDALSGDKRRHSAEALAAENANWIDFGWSSFGEASDLCRMINDLYTGAENGNEARLLRDRAARMIEEHIVRQLPMGGDPRVHELLRTALAVVIDSTFGAWSDSERYSKTQVLSAAGKEGLINYLEYALKPQLKHEIGALPDDMTFVFGHTHKPFVDQILCPTGSAIPTVNTGGWYLDNTRLDSRDGASIVLVSENFDTVSIRYFGVPTNDVVVPAKVELVSNETEQARAFANQIQGYVHNTLPAWRTLAQTAATAYKLRQKNMFKLMDGMDAEALQTGDLI